MSVEVTIVANNEDVRLESLSDDLLKKTHLKGWRIRNLAASGLLSVKQHEPLQGQKAAA